MIITMYLKILPIPPHTATERAEAISAELFAISRPPQVRQADDVSCYVFGWQPHPTEDWTILMAQSDYVINVHPDNNISGLVALFPDLSEQEIAGLTAFIQKSQSFEFGQILPSNTETITEQEFNDIFNTETN